MNPDDPTDDDDVLGPDADSDAAERARARGFAELIDKLMAGRTPAAVPAEDQPLLEVATAIRATVKPAVLAPARQRSIIEGALAAAIERRGGSTAQTSATGLPVVSIDRAPRQRAGRAPWLVATVTTVIAAAALVLLFLEHRPTRAPDAPAPVATQPLPFDQRSRPADALVGAIGRDRAGDAVGRIDAIYADRLSGFRDRTLYGGGTP